MKKGIQLITYPDCIGHNFNDLQTGLKKHFEGAIGGIHLLPFYPSSADRGFCPTRYDVVEESFGEWSDIAKLQTGVDNGEGDKLDLMFDFMVNHISCKSPYFEDYVQNGAKSEWADLFLPLTKVTPDGSGEVTEEDLHKIYTRKPRAPWVDVKHGDGSESKVWCTFCEEQMDLDVNSEVGKKFIEDNINALCQRGATMLRLDAFAYVTKKLGTNCFFVEPQVWETLDWIRDLAAAKGVEVLPEIHEHYTIQLKLAEKGYWVYDFSLPMLMLHTAFAGNTKQLKNWLTICPRKQITTLDTHDGIGVVDVKDLLTDEEVETTIETLYKKGANVKRRYSTADYDNLDIYQMNCTYYSALGDDDDAYLFTRAVQFFAPGIPQVYYVGMLAGRNDVELVETTRHGRDINRHGYTLEELDAEVERPAVQRMLALMKFRNNHPAFEGTFNLLESGDQAVHIRWENGEAWAELVADATSKNCTIRYSETDGSGATGEFVA